MRVFSVGWLYDNLERTREVAGITAEVTHNYENTWISASEDTINEKMAAEQ